MSVAKLYIFSGLPGSGKSTLAQMLSREFRCVYLRIDTIEQALRDICSIKVEGEGYRLAYRIASDNLRLGTNVIADSCNPIELTRREWRDVARNVNCQAFDIEVICSNAGEHRRRIETRETEVKNLVEPTWQDVVDRDYEPWTTKRVLIDTAGVEPNDSFMTLKSYLTNA